MKQDYIYIYINYLSLQLIFLAFRRIRLQFFYAQCFSLCVFSVFKGVLRFSYRLRRESDYHNVHLSPFKVQCNSDLQFYRQGIALNCVEHHETQMPSSGLCSSNVWLLKRPCYGLGNSGFYQLRCSGRYVVTTGQSLAINVYYRDDGDNDASMCVKLSAVSNIT